jgi:tetratricopeptide (TPR) repeat protein
MKATEALSTLDDPRVVQAIEEYLAEMEAGERPDRRAFLDRHADIAAALGACLDSLEFVHQAAAQLLGPGKELLGIEAPARTALGEFRILREVGRGGMGVVYEAEQLSLGRRVALKVLPLAATLDPKQLQRFKHEAQAAASLHHPHIVPIYAVGCERGMHYYAMQFIEGTDLAHLIAAARSGPSTTGAARFRTAGQLVLQAALALEHAHQLGIVHRDVKPANLLVDGHGHLWVTDFGLAHCQSQAGLTMTGDLVGTLRYMSPEQALAHPSGVDHRTDLYALGATLYELVALEPPFDGCDRHELLRQIELEEPRPLRRINNAVPAELETIILKAMAKDPAERYGTARDLAEDLERFLNDEPIQARRPTVVQRARRWARRHRPVIWSGVVGALVAVTVLGGCIGWIARDRAAQRVRIEQERAERQARTIAEVQAVLEEARAYRRDGKWPQAQAAAQRADALLHESGAEPPLVERVRSLLQELTEEVADHRLLARLDRLRLLQAEVNVKDDRFSLERALPDYRQVFQDYGWRVTTAAPEAVAASLRRRPAVVQGTVIAAVDHWLILARFTKAPETSWLERLLAAADTDRWRQRVRVARARNDRQALEALAREVDATAQPPEELFLIDRSLRQRGAAEGALELLQRAQEAFPGDFWINHDLGMALQEVCPPRREEAIRFLTVAVALRPESAGARVNLGAALLRACRCDEAITACKKAIELRPDYAMAYCDLGNGLAGKGRLDEAIAAYRRAIELKPDLALAYCNLGVALLEQRRFGDALAACRKALELRPQWAGAQFNLVRTLIEAGHREEAITTWRQSAKLQGGNPEMHLAIGNVFLEHGQLDEAALAYGRAIDLTPDFAKAHCNLGGVLKQQGKLAEAVAAYQRGHELGSRRPGWNYPSGEWLQDCKRLQQLEGHLPDILAGTDRPGSVAEEVDCARLCFYKRHYRVAARMWVAVFTAVPKWADDLLGEHRYEAACATALAGSEPAVEGGPFEDRERARWREQALQWLRAGLEANRKLLEGTPKDRSLLIQRLRSWQTTPDLAGLRGPAALAQLPADQQKACKDLWSEVAALLARAEAAR